MAENGDIYNQEIDLDELHNISLKKNMNSVVQPLLTDLYQITMAYAYWKSSKCSDHAVFDLIFRKNPFGGEFTVFAGLEECIKFIRHFHFSESDINYLRQALPQTTESEFFTFLSNLSTDGITLYAVPEGTVVFPRVPLIRVEGPLPIVQLLETALLNLVNYASLMATNAAGFRMAAGPNISLFEFGLRRAQGPDGGLSASKYSYIGGFDGTSNVLAGKLFNIPVKGTHAHAFVMSYSSCKELPYRTLRCQKTGQEVDFVSLCESWQSRLSADLGILREEANAGELAAFISYALAFPTTFLALIDTYDVIRSGLLNFCAVALALNDLGYKALGVRIDSGDLAYLSNVAQKTFVKISQKYNIPWFSKLSIVASNDINEETIISLNEQISYAPSTFFAFQGHKINCFGIGTHLVTCQKQPALGCVFKLVEVNSHPCIKLSLDVEKVTIPGRKNAYRLYGQDDCALIDLMQQSNEEPPQPRSRVLCRHPFQESKRAYVSPSRVEALLQLWWKDGKVTRPLPSLNEIRQRVQDSLRTIRPDIKRSLNPTPYKVSVSDDLYHFMHDLWLQNAPIGELS